MNFNPSNLNNLFQQTRQILSEGLLPLTEAGLIPDATINTGMPGQPSVTLASLFATNTLRLSALEVSAFLKELLQLPDEMKTVLLLLSMEDSPTALKTLLKQPLAELLAEAPTPPTVSAADIQALLAGNTQGAKDKLMKLLKGTSLAQTPGAQQLAEMTVSLTKLAEKIQTSPQQALETLVLLYLPWYPLAGKQSLELGFEGGQEGEAEGGNKELSVVIFLETNTLGRFKITIIEQAALQLAVILGHEEKAKPFVFQLEDLLNQYLTEDGLPPALFEITLLQPTAPAAEPIAEAEPMSLEKVQAQSPKTNAQKISVQPGQHISMLVLHAGYRLARFIFEADEQNRQLRRNRKAKV